MPVPLGAPRLHAAGTVRRFHARAARETGAPAPTAESGCARLDDGGRISGATEPGPGPRPGPAASQLVNDSLVEPVARTTPAA
jgi:hypothetical protein